MSVDISKATRLMKVVRLGNVRLYGCHAQANMAPDDVIEEVTADIKFEGIPVSQPAKDMMLVHANVAVSVRPVDSTDPVVTMLATFALEYSIPVETNPTQEELAAFAATNAVFNAWPYWREFVQSTFLRMSLPPILLPVFRLEDAGKQLTGTVTTELATERAEQAT